MLIFHTYRKKSPWSQVSKDLSKNDPTEEDEVFEKGRTQSVSIVEDLESKKKSRSFRRQRRRKSSVKEKEVEEAIISTVDLYPHLGIQLSMVTVVEFHRFSGKIQYIFMPQ